jgi:hypothetical protein
MECKLIHYIPKTLTESWNSGLYANYMDVEINLQVFLPATRGITSTTSCCPAKKKIMQKYAEII